MKIRFLIVFVFLFSTRLQSQEIASKLFDEGFENVIVNKHQDSIQIFFELREFRSPYHSMEYADLIIGDQLGSKNVQWIPLHHNIPIGKYSNDGFNYESLSKEELFYFNNENKPLKNYKWNFRIRPYLAARFGRYDNPFETRFDAIVDTRFYLAKGLSAQTGLLIPIENSLDNQGMDLRIAPSMLHYFNQIKPGHFTSLSFGMFHNDRYGFDIQYRYGLPSSNWSLGFETGFTGFYSQDGFSNSFSNLETIHFLADVEYLLPFENLNIRATIGRFLYEDFGGRVDMIKQFGLVDVGFFGTYTENGATGGFQFAIPIFPGNIFKNKNIQVRTTEEFRWEYTYNNEDRVGLKYRIGTPRLIDVLRQYRVNFIKSLNKRK